MPQRLAQHLLSRGLLQASTVDEALKRVERLGGTLDTVLLEMGAISEAGILQAISDVSGVRLVNLADFEPSAEAASLVPVKLARQLCLVPLSLDGNELHLAAAYPLPKSQLKDVGFLLSRRLELWVALEVRVRDWQAAVFGHELEPRFARLLAQVDPQRRHGLGDLAASGPGHEEATTLSSVHAAPGSPGLTEEPILLASPKKKPRPLIEPMDPHSLEEPMLLTASAKPKAELHPAPAELRPLGAEVEEEHRTTVLDPTAYGRFASEGTAKARPAPPPIDDLDSTRVMDVSGYENFGKEFTRLDRTTTDPELRAVQVSASFPGGVLPPRRSAPPAPPPVRKVATEQPFVVATGAPRMLVDRPRPSEPRPGRDFEVTALTPVPVAPPDDENDFSDLGPTPKPSRPPTRVEVAAPPPVAEAWPAAPVHPAQQHEVLLPSPPGLHPSPATEWTLAQARQSLAAVTEDREALLKVVLDYGRRTFEFVAAFAVMHGTAAGWDASGDGDLSSVRQLTVPLDAASVFRTVALTRGSYVGPLPPDALSQHYLSLMGRAPRTVFMWPVEVKSRLVAILYGDCGDRPVSQRRLADFILFCRELPTAFHELIVYRKNNPPPAPVFAPEQLASAAQALEASGAQDEWLSGLISLLIGPDASQRAAAMQELLNTPDLSAAALARSFPGPTGWSRLPVAELPEPDELGPVPAALSRLGEYGAYALAPLLDSEDSDARYLALLTAGAMRSPTLIDGVLRGLFDFEPDISSAARAAVAGLKDLPELQARLPGLRQDLASQDSLRRGLVARALGVLHDRESIDGLINLTASEDAFCAQSAAEALRETTRQNFGTNARHWTAWWAQARSRRRLEWLVEALASEDYESRLSAIEELTRAFEDHAGFFADGPASEREPALAAWRSFVASRPDLDL